MISKHRVRKLERQQRCVEEEVAEEALWPAQRYPAEEWLEYFEALADVPELAAEPYYANELQRFRSAIEDARQLTKWEPPTKYLPQLSLGERRRRWRLRNGAEYHIISVCVLGLGAAVAWLLSDEAKSSGHTSP